LAAGRPAAASAPPAGQRPAAGGAVAGRLPAATGRAAYRGGGHLAYRRLPARYPAPAAATARRRHARVELRGACSRWHSAFGQSAGAGRAAAGVAPAARSGPRPARRRPARARPSSYQAAS
nr:hypothetical protein [Tanacetum cinerariifolium]